MLLYIILALAALLFYTTVEGMSLMPSKEPKEEPKPNDPPNLKECSEWKTELLSNVKDQDYYYCSGINDNTKCGDLPTPYNPSQPCPPNFEVKSSRSVQVATASPMK